MISWISPKIPIFPYMFFTTKNGTLPPLPGGPRTTEKSRPKNRQHGLNLVKGICTGSQVRSWRFFSGKTHLGASLKGGKPTYANQTSQTVTAFRFWKQKKHEKNTFPPKKKGGNLHDCLVFSPQTRRGCWCVFSFWLAGLHGN